MRSILHGTIGLFCEAEQEGPLAEIMAKMDTYFRYHHRNYHVFYTAEVGELPLIWWDEECRQFVNFALLLYFYADNPADMCLCCGLQEAYEQNDYDRIRGWIAEHTDIVERIAHYRITMQH